MSEKGAVFEIQQSRFYHGPHLKILLMKDQRFFWVYALVGLCIGATPEPDEEPILESTGLETTYSEQGVIKWQMVAAKALQYENEDKAFPEGISMAFFEEDKEVAWTARANSVYFSAKKNVYELRGDVELKSLREKRQLNTEELYWNTETEEVYTDKFIRIEGENGMLTGRGLKACQDLSEYHISNPQGLLNVQSSK
ncbi:MAG: LPS export ABC transporter periplasmic protein LptC [Bacteroidota bacterium]